MRFSPRPVIRALLMASVAVLLPCRSLVCQVVELQGGGSSYFNGYGLNANFWGNGYEGWMGAGYQDAWRLGGFLRFRAGKDTVRAGNDVLTVRFPTDVFGLGYNVLVQGATWQATRGTFRYSAFGGASATGLGVPLFSARRADRAFATATVTDSIAPQVKLFATLIGATRQTIAAGAEWSDSARASLAATAGVGANRPFGALSGTFTRAAFELRGSFIRAAPGYARTDLPVPAQARLDGPALEVIVRPRDWFTLSATRQTYVKDSALVVEQARTTGSSFVASLQSGDAHAAGGVYLSESADGRGVSEYLAAGRTFGPRFAADVYALGSRPRGQPFRLTPVINLHERISQPLVLDQMITVSGAQTAVSLGGSWAGSLADVGVGYQIVYAPFDEVHPFQRTMTLTLRLNIGEYRTNVGTTVLPTGRTHYDVTAATFLYLGGENGLQPSALPVRLDRYVVRGVVRDEAGAPIAGAAVDVGGTLVFTDSNGRFFIRVGSRKPLRVAVRPAEFLTLRRYQVMSTPEFAAPEVDEKAATLAIIVRLLPQ